MTSMAVKPPEFGPQEFAKLDQKCGLQKRMVCQQKLTISLGMNCIPRVVEKSCGTHLGLTLDSMLFKGASQSKFFQHHNLSKPLPFKIQLQVKLIQLPRAWIYLQ